MILSQLSNMSICICKFKPDFYQGFGRVDLDSALKFDSSLSMFVQDYASIAENGLDVYKFTIPATSSGTVPNFRVTMTWTDPDTSASSAIIVLHDLDLYVTSDLTGATYYPNNLDKADSVNTVEKVVIKSPTPGDVLTVFVKGTSVSTTATQNYALVVNGLFASGAWYCQDPSINRKDLSYKTSYCRSTCASSIRTAVCCGSIAGEICASSEQDTSGGTCSTSMKPWDCISPTPSPTPSPTGSPSPSPTPAPTRAPTAPTKAPSRVPTAVNPIHCDCLLYEKTSAFLVE